MNAPHDIHPTFSVGTLTQQYRSGEWSPSECVGEVLRRIEASDRPEAWIHRVSAQAMRARAEELERLHREAGDAIFGKMPLFGVPFAVKDNVDVAGLPTTAACPEFAYTAERSASAVELLLKAGAILVGKTNLDQFATGLVGVRSPYGAVRQATFAERVSGGSSSGSAVAVATGCVAFSLGTDTAGSGRVPAGFNGLVGVKPTLGLVSKYGVVPACRTLDTLSIFATNVADAWQVLIEIARLDPADPYSRAVPTLGLTPKAPRLGVPARAEFFGDAWAEQAFDAALRDLRELDAQAPAQVDMTPLLDVAALLYDGPWVAERRAAVGALLDERPDAIDPTVAAVISKADRFSAVDVFNAQYKLAELRRTADAIFEQIDVLVVPTTPTHPTIEAVRANPIELNSQLGYYTNFVNLLDLCALAVPGRARGDGLPAGITLIAPAGADHRLAVLAERIEAHLAGRSASSTLALRPLAVQEPSVTIAVVGAHLRGQPLNHQLLEAGARFVEATTTTDEYRLFALAGTTPPKPALVHASAPDATAKRAIAIELWELPLRLFGRFVAQIPEPLGIGTVRVADGRTVKGFICEGAAVAAASGARDITAYGGWLAYLDSLTAEQQ